jgi:hypothetical protein
MATAERLHSVISPWEYRSRTGTGDSEITEVTLAESKSDDYLRPHTNTYKQPAHEHNHTEHTQDHSNWQRKIRIMREAIAEGSIVMVNVLDNMR